MGKYFYNLWTALSRLGNALLGGSPDHSISARIGASVARGGLASYLPIPPRIRPAGGATD